MYCVSVNKNNLSAHFMYTTDIAKHYLMARLRPRFFIHGVLHASYHIVEPSNTSEISSARITDDVNNVIR